MPQFGALAHLGAVRNMCLFCPECVLACFALSLLVTFPYIFIHFYQKACAFIYRMCYSLITVKRTYCN